MAGSVKKIMEGKFDKDEVLSLIADKANKKDSEMAIRLIDILHK